MQREIERQRLAATVQVENVPGAAGTIGLAQFVNGRRGDGEALLVNGLVMLGAILWNESPVSIAQVTPIARLTGEYEVVAVPAASPHRDMQSLVARAPRESGRGVLGRRLGRRHRSHPGGPHRRRRGRRSAADQLHRVLGRRRSGDGAPRRTGDGRHQRIQRVRPAHRVGPPPRHRRVGAERIAGLDVPTLLEQGLDVVLENWRAVMAPPGPQRIASERRCTAVVERMAHSDSWQATLTRLGWTDSYLDGPAFDRFLDDERVRVARIVSRLRTPAGEAGGASASGCSLLVVLAARRELMVLIFRVRTGDEAGATRLVAQGSPAAACGRSMTRSGRLRRAPDRRRLRRGRDRAVRVYRVGIRQPPLAARRARRLRALRGVRHVHVLVRATRLGVHHSPAGLRLTHCLDTLTALADGFAVALTPQNLLWALAGVTLGTAVGVLPGIGPALTVALLLPVTYSLDPTAAFIMFAGIYYGGMYGGSTTSILLNTPGESASVMTAVEGHLMARAGRGSAALATAAIGSFVAGTLATAALTFCAPLMVELALAFGPAEYFALAVLAFVAVCAALGESRLLGFASLLFGLLLGVIGIDPLTGVPRLTLGIPQLLDGIDVVVVVVGLFAVGEVLYAAVERRKAKPRSSRSADRRG